MHTSFIQQRKRYNIKESVSLFYNTPGKNILKLLGRNDHIGRFKQKKNPNSIFIYLSLHEREGASFSLCHK